MRQIPIRQVSFTTPTEKRLRLGDYVSNLYEQYVQVPSQEELANILEFAEQRLSQQPEEADVVHDLLAYLAQQMLDLNKQRQQRLEDLILDLEGVLSSADLQKIGRLWTPPSGETPVGAQEQLGLLAAERLELRDDIGKLNEEQWKWLLRTRLATQLKKGSVSLADLVRVYRQRQPAIATLDTRIAFTDSLIDQVVYRLYGLTDEEIAIIEASK